MEDERKMRDKNSDVSGYLDGPLWQYVGYMPVFTVENSAIFSLASCQNLKVDMSCNNTRQNN
jgi:hypothetical protein